MISDLEGSIEHKPTEIDSSTFEKRNDPKNIIRNLKMQLLNVYEKEIREEDEETGAIRTRKIIKPIPGTKPLCNKQGVQEIISYVENYINGHTVQSNFLDIRDFNRYMLFVAQDVTQHFTCMRKDWGLSINQLDILISRVVNIIDSFLRRALYNKERESYGETYKENYVHNDRVAEEKSPGILKKAFNSFARW